MWQEPNEIIIKDIIYANLRYTAEIKRSIVFCIKINLLISVTPREPFYNILQWFPR